MPSISNLGSELDLILRRGSTFGPVTLTLTNPDTTPVNLTGLNFSASIKRSRSDSSILLPFNLSVISAPAGTLSMSLSRLSVDSLTPVNKITDTAQYVWDFIITYTNGSIVCPMYGTVKVVQGVTR